MDLGSKDYIKAIKDRKKQSKIYSRHQSFGLTLADLLGDQAHKALYMKLAREYDPELLLTVAKEVADRGGVRNRGAYFMKIIAKLRKDLPRRPAIAKLKPKPKPKQLQLKLRPSKKPR